MKNTISRRNFIKAGAMTGAAATLSVGMNPGKLAAQSAANERRFKYCLNTSTIRGQRIPLDAEIDLIAQAGYEAVEPWINEIQSYQESGGSLSDLEKKIADRGLTVESAIGFANWIVDDDADRRQGLEQAKRDMELVRRIGGIRIAAPPAGATQQEDLDLSKAAERYHALLEIGKEMGVIPQLELWGFSKTLSRLGEVAFVAIESGHPDACLLLDVYHVYKGGSDVNGLKLVSGKSVTGLHMNDYPATPPRATITDSERVYPGDGIAPVSAILQYLLSTGYEGTLSLELFNQNYWQRDAAEVLKTGLQKMKAEVRKATG